MPNHSSIIIIGSGMAGLSAGCYAQMSGFQTRIFEMNHRPGGVCQSWERQGYTVNGCIHWLVGSGAESNFHQIWKELGAVQQLEFMDHDRFGQYEHPEGTVVLYSDVDRLEQHLLEVAPEDDTWIRRIAHGIRVLSNFEMNPPEEKQGLKAMLQNVRLILTRFPAIREMMKWWGLTFREFNSKLRSPLLRTVFANFWHEEMSMLTFIMTMSFLNNRVAGYPLGGSSRFIEQVVNRYESLGGQIEYNQRVEEILVRGTRAYGIRLDDGAEHYADFVISAADGHATIYHMLKGRYADARIEANYRELKPFPPLLFASFGVEAPFDDLPSSVFGLDFPLHEPLTIGDRRIERLGVQVYNFDPALAPPGHATLSLMLEADFDYWLALYQDQLKYEAAKEEVLRKIVLGLEQRFAGISTKIKMLDLATPVTYYHYTGNYRGSYEGWLPTPLALRTQMRKTLPGLDRFYMAGHWVEPGGGLPPAAMSGRNVIRAICREQNVAFRAQEPEPAEDRP